MKTIIFSIALMMVIFINNSFFFNDDNILQDNKELAVKLTSEAYNIIKEIFIVEDSLERVQKYSKALNLLNDAIKLDSNYLPAYSNKLLIFEELKNYSEALKTTEEIREIKGIYPELFLTQGILLEKLSRSEEAEIKFKEALSLFYQKVESDTSSIFNDKINICYLILFLDGKEKALYQLDELKSNFPDRKESIEYHQTIIENFDWDEYFKK